MDAFAIWGRFSVSNWISCEIWTEREIWAWITSFELRVELNVVSLISDRFDVWYHADIEFDVNIFYLIHILSHSKPDKISESDRSRWIQFNSFRHGQRNTSGRDFATRYSSHAALVEKCSSWCITLHCEIVVFIYQITTHMKNPIGNFSE